jgi:hypothetical protein
MKNNTLGIIFWLHTLIVGVAGLALYIFPAVGGVWPWPLPPLAARFVGSLLIGAAINTGLTAAARDDQPAVGALLMGLILYGLIALTGVLGAGEIGLTTPLLIWIGIFAGMPLLAGALLAARAGTPLDRAGARPQSRFLRWLLALDLLLVAPVGLLMYFAPVVARSYWPWDLPPINVRLIGSIFVATMALSFWALRQRTWEQVKPSVAAGGTFATLALIASFLHFSQFNPDRLVTWLFIALYAFVAAGSWLAIGQYARGRRLAS